MKPLVKICLVAMCITIHFQLYSQSVISDNKQWNIAVGVYNGVDITYTTSSFKFNGDTLLGNVRYAKLYESVKSDYSDWHLYALMREEADKLIRRDLKSNNEIEVSDFTVQPADSFITEQGSKLVVESVTQAEWGGKVRKIITLHSLESPNDSFLWIEGVGNMRLFAHSGDILPGGWSYTLLCFTENGQQVYLNPDYNTCYIKTSVETLPEAKKDLLGITSKGNRELKISTAETGRLLVTTTDGRAVLQKRIYQPETTLHLPIAGVLLYRFTTNNDEVQTGKVVVK